MTAIRSSLAIQLLIPAALFGYAAFANFGMPERLQPAHLENDLSLTSVLNGGVTVHLEKLYRDGLPHRQLAVEMIGAARYILLGEGRRGVVAGQDGYLFTDEEFRSPANIDAYVTASVEQIVTISKTLGEKGVQLAMVPLPAKNDVYSDEVEQPGASAYSQRLYDDFRTRLEARGVKTVDTRSVLMSARQDRQVFLKTDTHWTPAGAQAVAGAVATQVLGETSGHYEILEGAEDRIEGDLVKYVTGGIFASLVGLGSETVTPYHLAQKSGDQPIDDIFGNATSIPVALVGTSYSANELWSFASFLSFQSGLDVANAALVGQGPVAPMRHYLASLENAESMPQTVLWEFPVRFLTDAKLWADAPAAKEARDAKL
jgi:alginate O-acetyltransferase complex protein AlgJ